MAGSPQRGPRLATPLDSHETVMRSSATQALKNENQLRKVDCSSIRKKSRKMVISGKQIAAARALLGISQNEPAVAADVNANTIMRFETGQNVPRLATIRALKNRTRATGNRISERRRSWGEVLCQPGA